VLELVRLLKNGLRRRAFVSAALSERGLSRFA